jgi:mRNA interferase MazF
MTIGASSTGFRRGEILLVPFPFSDLSTTKVRPAVVVSGTLYQRSEPDLVLAEITSRLDAATGPFDYILRDWRAAGLRFPSALKPVLFTLDPIRVLHQVGVLTPADLTQVDARLRRILDL